MAQRAASAVTAAADPVAAAHARLLRDKSIQFDFRSIPPPKPLGKTPEWMKALGHFIEALAPLVKIIFWAGLGLILLTIVVFVARELIYARWPSLKRKKKKAVAVEPDWRPTPAQALALLDEADRLAAQGRYAEAARLILFRSIEEIQGRRPHLLKPALTSRDISVLDGLPQAARGAFAGIARIVEHSFFGGRAINADDFRRCRDAYEAFAFPETWA